MKTRNRLAPFLYNSLVLTAACSASLEPNSEPTDTDTQAVTTAAGYTPPTAKTTTTPSSRVWTAVAMGDSYGSGEGAPSRDGKYDSDKGVATCPETENVAGDEADCTVPYELAQWDTSDSDSDFCARSTASGSALAAKDLGSWIASEFPSASVRYRSFACSGAVVEELTTNSQMPKPVWRQKTVTDSETGVKKWRLSRTQRSAPLPPQIDQAKTWLAQTGGAVDAAYVSIGGNDAAFASVIFDCIASGFSCADATGWAWDEARAGLASLDSKYLSLRANLDGLAKLVTISEYPYGFSNDDGTRCGDGKSDPDTKNDEWYTNEIEADEYQALNDSLLSPLNSKIKSTAALFGWNRLSWSTSHSAIKSHGICAAKRYFNQNKEALSFQGVGDEGNGKDYMSDTSSGFVHPNRDGHRYIYAPSILAAWKKQVVEGWAAAPSTAWESSASSSAIAFRWNDNSRGEDGYEITVSRLSGAGFKVPGASSYTSGTATYSVGKDVTQSSIQTQGVGVYKVEMRTHVTGKTVGKQYSSVVTSIIRSDNVYSAPSVAAEAADTAGITFSAIPGTAKYSADTDGIEYFELSISVGGAAAKSYANSANVDCTQGGCTAKARACNMYGCGSWSTTKSVSASTCSGGASCKTPDGTKLCTCATGTACVQGEPIVEGDPTAGFDYVCQ